MLLPMNGHPQYLTFPRPSSPRSNSRALIRAAPHQQPLTISTSTAVISTAAAVVDVCDSDGDCGDNYFAGGREHKSVMPADGGSHTLSSPLPSPYSVDPDILQTELDHIASSFSETEWSRTRNELEKIDDVATLRQLVLEKERDLHLAARLGLVVARKNQEIEGKLHAYANFETETQRKLAASAAMNTDAYERWKQEQSNYHEDMQERFDMVTRVNTELRRELDLFREEFQTFRKDVTHLNGRMDDLSLDVQDTKRRLLTTGKQISTIEGDMATTGEVTQELQGQLESTVSSHRHHYSKTKQAVRDVLRGHSRMVDELEQLRSNVSILTDRQHFSEERVSELIEEYTSLLTNAQNTILSLHEEHLEADMMSDQHSDSQLSSGQYSNGYSSGYQSNEINVHGLHTELSTAMARTESTQKRITFMRASRSQLDLRRAPTGLKDLVQTKTRERAPASAESPLNSRGSVRVLHSYTRIQ